MLPGGDKAAALPPDEVAALQERAARAVPAALVQRTDGVLLRASDAAASWWVGSALLHGPDVPADLEGAVATVERFYRAQGIAPLVQVCPGCPPGLDGLLAARGYRRVSPVSMMVADAEQVARLASPSSDVVALSDTPDDTWLAVGLAGHGPAERDAEQRLLRRVRRPTTYATMHADGLPVAVGRAVADSGWVGVFGMATVPWARRRGAGSAVLAALAAWALRQRCPSLYLQVLADDAAPVALYRRSRFTDAFGYHYRAARVAPGPV